MINQIITNAGKPAPKWYRKAKRAIALLSGPTVLAVAQTFNLNDSTMAKIGTLIAFLPTALEILNVVLVDDNQVYANSEDVNDSGAASA
jgi:hypothetical protein